MWLPSLSTFALLAASFHIALADRIEARAGKQFDKNAIIEPLGGTLDTTYPIVVKWKPDTKGTVSIKLLKGKSQGMVEHETIADHVENTGVYIWLTGDWLEDSSTMEKGHKYGLKIIDDETENYNYSPEFDLRVPDSTFKEGQTNPPIDDDDNGGDGNDGDDDGDGDNDVDGDDGYDDDGYDDDGYDDDGYDDDGYDDDGYDDDGYDDDGDDDLEDDNNTIIVVDDGDADDGNDLDELEEDPTSTKHHFHGHPESKGSHGNQVDDADSDEDFEEPVRHFHGQPKTGSHGNHVVDDDTDFDESDFVEPEGSVEKGQNHYHKSSGKPKPGTTTTELDDDEQDFVEPDSPATGSNNKPPVSGKVITVDGTVNFDGENSGNSGGLPKAAKIGIAVGVVAVFVLLVLGIVLWRLRRHKKSQKEKMRSRIGYDGVGSFIADGRKSQLYDGPQMTQYNPAYGAETRYDPPTGQGLPVVASTSTPRPSVDTRYDPPSQAHQGHH